MSRQLEDAVPTFTLDYASFTGGGADDEGSSDAAPILVIYDRHSKYLAAAVVDGKGPTPGALAFAEDAVAAAGLQ